MEGRGEIPEDRIKREKEVVKEYGLKPEEVAVIDDGPSGYGGWDTESDVEQHELRKHRLGTRALQAKENNSDKMIHDILSLTHIW